MAHDGSSPSALGSISLLLIISPSNTLSRYFDVMGRPGTEAELQPPVSDFPVDEAIAALAPHGVSILGPGPSLVEDGPPAR
jgi:hypothetical protein